MTAQFPKFDFPGQECQFPMQEKEQLGGDQIQGAALTRSVSKNPIEKLGIM